MKKSLVLALAVIGMSATSQAASYGMAGCGLGSLVFRDEKGPIQIVSAILNVIGTQTSAITTGTSNCREEGSEAASDKYIEINQVALKEDIARGNGETLAGLLTILRCSDSSKVGPALQQNYGSIFSTDSVEQIKSSIQNTIRANKEASASCPAMI